jgi:hypothetical protein
MPPIERALLVTVPWLAGGLLLSVPLLFVSPDDSPLGWFVAQLIGIVAIGLGLTFSVVAFGDEPWFVEAPWGQSLRSIASGVSLVVLVTGTVGLITLASSAALGFDPSVQFLQLLSALDIAWAGAALSIGVYRMSSRAWAIAAGSMLGIVCVWSVWNYLSIVGFGPHGSWIVSGSDLLRYVIPFDIAAALGAIVFFLLGVRSQVHAIEHPSPQS